MLITPDNLALLNANLRYEDPKEIIAFVLEHASKPMVSTSFGPFSASLLHAVTELKPETQVIWCDTGYNLSLIHI